MTEITRRDFARGAGLATALSYSRILGANDRVGMGYIGLGNRGDQVHDAFLEHGDCQTVAVCDLRDDYLDFAVKKSRATPKKYKEYAKLLEDKDVDAVVIATPDHWHALMFIDACNAGKDVYVEKPLSLTVVEGRKMVETAERTRRVSAGGHQPPVVEIVSGSGRIRSFRRHRPRHASRAAFTSGTSGPSASATAPDSAASQRLGMGPLARPGAEGAVQPQPHLLQLSLVLRLFRRPAHQLRRALRGHHSLVPGPGLAAFRHRHRRKIRGHSGQPRDPGHT